MQVGAGSLTESAVPDFFQCKREVYKRNKESRPSAGETSCLIVPHSKLSPYQRNLWIRPLLNFNDRDLNVPLITIQEAPNTESPGTYSLGSKILLFHLTTMDSTRRIRRLSPDKDGV